MAKSVVLQVRVSHELRAELAHAAFMSRVTLSEWLRHRLREAAGLNAVLASADGPSRPSEEEKDPVVPEPVDEPLLPSEEVVLPSGNERAICAVADEIHKRLVLDRFDDETLCPQCCRLPEECGCQ